MSYGILSRFWDERGIHWSDDGEASYPLVRQLAQQADFPRHPSELCHYNQLVALFDIVPFGYDQQGRLLVNISVITVNEQQEALEILQEMPDISPQSIVERTDRFSGSGDWIDRELPWMIRLQDYLNCRSDVSLKPFEQALPAVQILFTALSSQKAITQSPVLFITTK